MHRALLSATILSGAAAVGVPSAHALEVYLAAVRTCVMPTGPNGGDCSVKPTPKPTDPVPVWSFVTISPAEYTNKAVSAATMATAVVPGPLLTVDSTASGGLTVHLLNTLPVPVSLVIPGLPNPLTPVWVEPSTNKVTTGSRLPGDVTSRVRSLDHETAPGATGDYTWPTLIPGSFLYESGTHQAIQVQMGLHGPLVIAGSTTTAGQPTGTAYPGVSFTQQVTTYLSEIDADMHRTIDSSPSHDAAPTLAAKVSPLQYWPNIFLTSQFVLAADQSVMPVANGHNTIVAGQPTLMRFFNATLRTHVQIVQDENLSVVAEDSQPYRYPKNQYSVLLDAGKTKDAMMVPATVERIAVYDRMLNTGDPGNTQQGLLAGLDVAALSTPIAYNDTYSGPYGVPLTVTDAKGVLLNDVSHDAQPLTATVITTPKYGTVTLNPNGGFTYTPQPGSGQTKDMFTYTASETVKNVAYTSQQTTVTLTFTATAPTAVADTYYVGKGKTLSVLAANGVLTNDTPAGNTALQSLTTTPVTPAHAVKNGFSLAPNGSFSYTPVASFTGTDGFSYTANNPAGVSNIASVTINVLAAPVAGAYSKTVTHGTTYDFAVPTASATAPISSLTVPAAGTASIINNAMTIHYIAPTTLPPVGQRTVKFSYVIADLAGQTATNTITVTLN